MNPQSCVTLAAALLVGARALAQDAVPAPEPARASAIFAAGCFWCAEHDFATVPGVIEVVAGYTGGHVPAPSYAQVSAGGTGHVEAVRVIYDPHRISYSRLLAIFWRNVDPVDAAGQFCDRGSQYRAALFPASRGERAAALASRAAVEARLQRRVVTAILPAARFWPAEARHQDYAANNPIRYRFYRLSCGRDARLTDIWRAR